MCLRYCDDDYGAHTLEHYATLRKEYLAKGNVIVEEKLKELTDEEVGRVLGYTPIKDPYGVIYDWIKQWEVL